MRMSGNMRMVLLGLLTLTLFPLLSLGILWFVNGNLYSFWQMFKPESPIYLQVVIGVLIGFITGFLAWKLINTQAMLPVLQRYGPLIRSLKLTWPIIVFISVCAGVGEEIFFRGVLQDYLYVIPTAIIFVGIHGYLSFTNWRIALYGIYMTLVIILLGYLDIYMGLYTAIVAHTVIDVILFFRLSNLKPESLLDRPIEHEHFAQSNP